MQCFIVVVANVSRSNLAGFTQASLMTIKRIIARLDVKPPNLVKGVHLEGFRVMGSPIDFANEYYAAGVDELMYQDVVASLYERSSIHELVTATVAGVFVPLTVGGGVRTVADVHSLLRAGADKVAMNTGAVRDPSLITHAADAFGAQAVVVSIEAKRYGDTWLVMTDSGREHTGRNVDEWAREVTACGAGEIVLTSIDCEGTSRGFDLGLLEVIRETTGVPIVAHGGIGSAEQAAEAFAVGADGVALASVLHYRRQTVTDIKSDLSRMGFEMRI